MGHAKADLLSRDNVLGYGCLAAAPGSSCSGICPGRRAPALVQQFLIRTDARSAEGMGWLQRVEQSAPDLVSEGRVALRAKHGERER